MTQDDQLLQEIDPGSPSFKAIIALVQGRNARSLSQLKTKGLPADQTEHVRGQMAEQEWLLGLTEAKNKLPQQQPRPTT